MIKSLITILAFLGFAVGGDAEQPYLGAVGGDAEQPYLGAVGGDAEQPFTAAYRAIDSNELKGFNSLEAHDADEWFV